MNQQTVSTPKPSVLSDSELTSIHELSRLDQLFVQQIEDFLHFGYRSVSHQKPPCL